MLLSELIYMIKSQFYHIRNPDITRFFDSMSTKKDLEDFTLQGLIFMWLEDKRLCPKEDKDVCLTTKFLIPTRSI